LAVKPYVQADDPELPPELPPEVAASPHMAPLESDRLAKMFESARAMREPPVWRTLDPHAVPEPPQLKSSRFGWKLLARTFFFSVFTAGAVFAAIVFVFPEAKRALPPQKSAPSTAANEKADRVASQEPRRAEPARVASTETRRATVNEPVPLGVTVTGGSDDSAVLISGLAVGARLSAGQEIGSGTWRVRLTDIGQARVIPPTDFIGVMNITAALVGVDAKVIDKGLLRIDWARPAAAAPALERSAPSRDASPAGGPPPPPELLTLDRGEIDGLLKRGRDFLENGDIAAARLVLRRAANGGDAQAALLLGKTFDPKVIEQLHVIGVSPNPAEAQRWYQRALELGLTSEARRRLERPPLGAH
jgi:hypothetical protein